MLWSWYISVFLNNNCNYQKHWTVEGMKNCKGKRFEKQKDLLHSIRVTRLNKIVNRKVNTSYKIEQILK